MEQNLKSAIKLLEWNIIHIEANVHVDKPSKEWAEKLESYKSALKELQLSDALSQMPEQPRQSLGDKIKTVIAPYLNLEEWITHKEWYDGHGGHSPKNYHYLAKYLLGCLHSFDEVVDRQKKFFSEDELSDFRLNNPLAVIHEKDVLSENVKGEQKSDADSWSKGGHPLG